MKIVRFGGGKIALKQNVNNINKSTPPSVQLLFENTSLDLIKTLLLLYAFSSKNKKRFKKIQEIVFYYSLVNFDLAKIYHSAENTDSIVFNNQFYRFQFSINRILLLLNQFRFIEFNGEFTQKIDDIGIKINDKGKEFVEGLESEYFKVLLNEYKEVIKSIEFSNQNLKKIRGEG